MDETLSRFAAIANDHGRDELWLGCAQLDELGKLRAEGCIASQHQLDERAALAGSSFLARRIKRHADIRVLRLCEFERDGLFPAAFTIVEVGVSRRQIAMEVVDLGAD